MTTLFKAITKTVPKPINQNGYPHADSENYTRLIIRDLMIGEPVMCVNINATVVKPKNWADKSMVRCDDIIASMTAMQPSSNNVEMLAERIASECLSNESVCDVTVRVEKKNTDGSYATTGIEIFRKN